MNLVGMHVRRSLTLVHHPLLSVEKHTPQIVYMLNRFAGHSHWQNIRHTKEAKDKERMRITTNFLLQIDTAIKLSGGIRDPKLNSKLASVIADAKSKNVPMDTINRRLAAQDVVDPYVIEIQAPGGIFALIETRCKNIKSTKDKIQALAKKYGFKVSKSNPGSIANEFFEHKGIISIIPQKFAENIDAATELAIECGANDVEEAEIDVGVKGFEFHCEVKDVDKVRQSLESRGVNVYGFYSPYLAIRKVSISAENCKLMSEMYDRIREAIDHADNFYDNCEAID